MRSTKIAKSSLFYLALIVITASVIRYIYSVYHPTITVASDTFGYYEIGNRILMENISNLFFNDERTPIYPLFLASIMKLQGFPTAVVLSDEFYTGARLIVFIQHIIGILSLILMFFILRLLKVKSKYAFLLTIIISINPMVFFWEKVLVTETLTTFFLLLTLYIFLKGLETGKTVYFILLLSSLIFGFLLKPFYLFLPLFLLPVIPLYKNMKKSFMLFISITLVFLLIPLIYIRQNKINYQYNGINRSGDINLLGKILKYNLPVERAIRIEYFYENVKNYRTINGNSMPYRFLEFYEPRIYDDDNKKLMNLLPEFNFKVITGNLPEFVIKSLQELPQALSEKSEMITPTGSDKLSVFFILLFNIYNKLQYLFFLVFAFFPLSMLLFSKKRKFKNTSVFLLGVISVYQIFFSLFLSYGEFGRLIAPAQPVIYLFIFLFLPVIFPVLKIIFNRSSDTV